MTPPFTLRGLDHLALPVTDMARSLTFYRDILGCPVTAEWPEDALLRLRVGTSDLFLVDVTVAEGAWAKPPTGPGRNLDHLCIALEACDEAAVRRHLAAHGLDIIEERAGDNRHGPTLSLYICDPDGTPVELLLPSP
ncbi:VOC family protein [Nitrospirillum pindoramense]|uniref:Glyoxylase I family protein n=1 Tax=Nitrospirillum amazonense TaxID=28077 RepID=A0A560HBL2_9PROT|nr:VOC family protein [Nitrospirillum amazonense]TWB43748.1 glyoxylase I family protein [Nitrospirillum amazonense]